MKTSHIHASSFPVFSINKTICIGNHNHEFECKLGNNYELCIRRKKIAQGEAKCNFILLIRSKYDYFPKLHENSCDCMVIS